MFSNPEDGILHSHRREDLKSYPCVLLTLLAAMLSDKTVLPLTISTHMKKGNGRIKKGRVKRERKTLFKCVSFTLAWVRLSSQPRFAVIGISTVELLMANSEDFSSVQ
jgi:hypothetical protein